MSGAVLMRLGEVRRMLGVTTWTLRTMIAEGAIRKVPVPCSQRAYYDGEQVREIARRMQPVRRAAPQARLAQGDSAGAESGGDART